MSASRKKGTAWESAIVTYLRANGAPHAERRALAGNVDRGDIAGVPDVVFEAKSGAFHLAQWLDEAELERANDHARYGIVWAKRPGKTSPADGYAILSGAALVQLLTEAGYIATPGRRPARDLVVVDELDFYRSEDHGLLAELRQLVQRHNPPPPGGAALMRVALVPQIPTPPGIPPVLQAEQQDREA